MGFIKRVVFLDHAPGQTYSLAASAGVEDEDRKAMYADLVLSSLSEAVRRALDPDMKYEYQSEFARRYFSQGREEGLRPLVHLFERRLGRVLTPAERARLVEQVTVLVPDRVGDVVLDLSAEDLATWLATKSDHGEPSTH